MVLFWELKFFDLMIRHHAGVMSENHKRGWNIANSHKDFSMKLGTLVDHDETMCHAQEP